MAHKEITFLQQTNKKTVLLNVLLFFTIGFVAVIARWVTTAYFTHEVGSNSLPSIYSVSAFIHFLIALYIVIHFSKYAILKFIRWIIFAIFIVFFASSMLFLTPISLKVSASILIIVGTRLSSIIEMIMWICAAQFFSGQKAKEIYSYLIAANSAGLLFGGGFLIFFPSFVSTAGYIGICAFCTLIAFLIVYNLEKNCWHASFEPENNAVRFTEFFKKITSSTMWVKILIISITLYCFFYVSDFQFIVAAQDHFRDLNKITRFFGYFEIISATSIILFSWLFYKAIQTYGVWKANAIALLLMFLSFLIIYIFGEDIYSTSISRLINILCFKLGLVVIGIICKNAKEKYQSTLISIFDFVPVSVGTLIAGQLCYILTFGFLSFNNFSLMMAGITFSIYIWFLFSKSIYVQVLIEGIADEQYEKLIKYDKQTLSKYFSSDSVYDSIGRSVKDVKEYRIISFEVPIKIREYDSIKILLSILEGLDDSDSYIRIKALQALVKYKEIQRLITPFILKKIDDEDIEVAGQAIMTLHEFEPEMAKQHAPEILNTLVHLEHSRYQILSLNIISALKLSEFKNTIITAMEHSEDRVRENAYRSFGNICIVDSDEAIEIFTTHLGEQSSIAANALINAIYNSIITKKECFYELVFSADPFVWKSVTELLIKWRCYSEYDTIILTAINKVHLIYENLESIQLIFDIDQGYYGNILAQHLVLQNELILKAAISIVARDSYDHTIVDSLYKEIRSFNTNIKSTALELIENLGEKKLTKHLLAYFSLHSSKERIKYAKKNWHTEKANLNDTFRTLLMENNEWIKACTIKMIASMKNRTFDERLREIIINDKSVLVKTYAEMALKEILQEIDMKSNEIMADYLDIVVSLKHSKLFKDISLNTIAILTKSLIEKKFLKGETLIKQGEVVNGLFLIYEGTISINQSVNNREYFVMELEKLSVIGSQYMIEEAISDESFVAKTDVTAIYISKSLYKNMIVLHPEIAHGLLNEVCAYLITYHEAYKRMISVVQASQIESK